MFATTKMVDCCYVAAFLLVLSSFIPVLNASAGDADPNYRSCVTECGETGCVGGKCFPECTISLNGVPLNHSRNLIEKLIVQWKKGSCKNNCQYHCMIDREEKRALLDHHDPIKYNGKWPYKCIYGIQEPASVALLALNLAMHFHGWISFISLLKNKLPLKVGKKAHYGYAGLWHVYGFLSVNAFFWCAVRHSRDMELTEKLDHSSTVALVGFSLILAILRTLNISNEANRVMISAPLTSFVTTHILYNCFMLDFGWNETICQVLIVMQLTVWTIWGVINQHPSRWKVLLVIFGSVVSLLLQAFDFPPYQGLIDAHALSLASTVPFAYLWWSFVRNDAEFLASKRVKRSKMKSK
ncbi:hypothetical protein HN51_044605 [Arachis hypogaea]|uniref:Post-GPI attachment to proteins factor 3 n=2 Tax=Arachis hypogaea TaxID=3818 RepID=A0A444Y1Y5_ARAHY|nr:post-GPI attachment to proteins factor 3-like [Arachis ipaensis]RYQ95951.1 hypothetical protein Ahy_B08g091346 [Arachis hypogaea]